MAKEDAPTPKNVPRKRYQLEAAPARWLAEWLARTDLHQKDRERVEAEKLRRKSLQKEKVLGIIVMNEGATPEQAAKIIELIETSGATEIHHPYVASRIHQACKRLGVPIVIHKTPNRYQEVVKASDALIAAPELGSSMYGTKAWEQVRYAVHRRIPVRAVLSNGEVIVLEDRVRS